MDRCEECGFEYDLSRAANSGALIMSEAGLFCGLLQNPDLDVRTALAIFDAAQTDTLAVTERESGVVIGLLGEAFAARRYAQETDLAAKGVLGGG